MLRDDRRRKLLKFIRKEIRFVSQHIRDVIGRDRRVDAVSVVEQDGYVVFELQCEWEEVSVLFAGAAPAAEQAMLRSMTRFMKKYEQAVNKRLQRR